MLLRCLKNERGMVVSVDFLVIITVATVVAAIVVGILMDPLRSLHERAVEGIKSVNETGF